MKLTRSCANLLASVTATLLLSSSTACLATPLTPAIAPLKPQSADNARSQTGTQTEQSNYQDQRIGTLFKKKQFARIAAAAICTEDLATISFAEYEVDWSAWVDKAMVRWSKSMDSASALSAAKPSGPLFVEFTCRKDGTVTDVMIDHSSGDRSCDAMTIANLLRCLPFPSFPTASRKSSITLLCIISYDPYHLINKTAHRHADKQPIKVSISGASL